MSENQDLPSGSNPEEIFKKRFVEVMTEMGENTRKDPESVWLIGSLSASLLDQSKSHNWVHFKKALTPEIYNSLINSFRQQGNQLAKEGNEKAAFAVEVLALSIIAPTLSDENEPIASGDKLLNKMVQDSIDFFRRNQTTVKRPN